MERKQTRAQPRISAIGTATPSCDIHAAYAEWARSRLSDPREITVLDRMLARGGIEHRYSVLQDVAAAIGPDGFYGRKSSPGTEERMKIYAAKAPELAMTAIGRLPSLQGITHLVIASCTGFIAPGLDQVLARRLGLAPDVQRLSIGFMGCYAGVTLLRTACQIVQAQPDARVLAVSVELCTLHLQESGDLEALLAMGQFADGAAAAIVSAQGDGLFLGEAISATLDDSEELITWAIGDTGFVMHLSGAVPRRLADAFASHDLRNLLQLPKALPAFAVHPGGKSILDAVERGLELPADALEVSRDVLATFGNMSSASVIFVLSELMRQRPERGIALAFGPGLAMEGLHFGWIEDSEADRAG